MLDRALAAPDALPPGDLRVLAAGKAAASMASIVARLMRSRIRSGLIVGAWREGASDLFEWIPGSHPVPSADSERAGRRALAIAGARSRDEILLVLLSGGASAMMAVPAEGISLEDKRQATERLLKAGADIHALNTVRKHISGIKGGWLAVQAAGPSKTFAISDVVGDDLSVIASGPTVADSTTFADAIEVLKRFGGLDAYPAPVVARLAAGQHGDLPETPKPGDRRLDQALTTVIGGRHEAMAGATAEAEARGYHTLLIPDAIDGEARQAAVAHLKKLTSQAARAERPLCVVSSGETTVHVTGAGKGGRNQEFALAVAEFLASSGHRMLVASAGTDGIDGPTDAAGALVDWTTVERAKTAGIGPPDEFLSHNDAYAYFAALGDLIHTGPTDTNVGDLQVVIIA
ncbi:MAG: glycerate kinase [Blastocatellia bacterium]|nr:MAG: glycerate kinase [Blastocatellia bacterium]